MFGLHCPFQRLVLPSFSVAYVRAQRESLLSERKSLANDAASNLESISTAACEFYLPRCPEPWILAPTSPPEPIHLPSPRFECLNPPSYVQAFRLKTLNYETPVVPNNARPLQLSASHLPEHARHHLSLHKCYEALHRTEIVHRMCIELWMLVWSCLMLVNTLTYHNQ